jgi:hypothetical protein
MPGEARIASAAMASAVPGGEVCPISVGGLIQTTFPQRRRRDPWGNRFSRSWYQEGMLVLAVFSLTGTATVNLRKRLVQAIKQNFGVDLSQMMSSSWSIWLMSFTLTMPLYYTLLFVIGTLFGRHAYFSRFALRMWHRLQQTQQKLFVT